MNVYHALALLYSILAVGFAGYIWAMITFLKLEHEARFPLSGTGTAADLRTISATSKLLRRIKNL